MTDTRDMVLVHRAFRRELGLQATLTAAASLPNDGSPTDTASPASARTTRHLRSNPTAHPYRHRWTRQIRLIWALLSPGGFNPPVTR